MKTLVVFYSRSGNTKKVALEISKMMNADVEEILDEKDRSGVVGYLSAGKDATFKSLGKIKKTNKNPKDYDLVIAGTPVWAFTVSTPVKTYLDMNKENLKEVAFFATQGGSGADNAFKEMEKVCGKKPRAVASMTEADVKANRFYLLSGITSLK
ncbi:MAG: NAD(P)H-dependent oxidoreductase [Candidatus Altiarchaeota archaeon]|nr:NAD(P)H-dependent oxidoreductase [Candidatus Altiarchaeota archaeon]